MAAWLTLLSDHHLGLQLFQQAINYGQRILDSEGGEAAFLLGKDADCCEAFRYAMDILKCDDKSGIFNSLKHIEKLTTDSLKLPELQQLSDYRKHIGDVVQLMNDFIGNPNLHQIASEITDLSNQADSYLNEACIAFQTESNKAIAQTKEEIIQSQGFDALTEEEKQMIVTRADELNLEYGVPTLDNLQVMVNKYTTYYLPNGAIDQIRGEVKRFATLHAPAVVPTPVGTHIQTTSTASPEETPTQVQETGSVKHQLRLKRNLTTRQEVEQLISELQRHLDEVSEQSPLELSIND